MPKRPYTTIILFLFTLTAFANQKVEIIKNGKANSFIMIPETPTSKELFAANELRNILQQMSGTRLDITPETASTKGSGLPISVGRTQLLKKSRIKIPQGKYPIPEKFVMKIDKNGIFLCGNDAPNYEGTLFAVYQLLKTLGCRWYMPGKLGEYIPKQKTVTLNPEETYQKPDFIWRQPVRINYRNKASDKQRKEYWQWMKRNFQGGPSFAAIHSFSKMVPDHYFKTHPEYFALIKGKRTAKLKTPMGGNARGQLCTSNPEVIKLATQYIRNYFKKRPNATSCSISPSDHNYWCECPECYSLSPFRIDRLLIFFNTLAKNVEKEFPNKKLCFYVYSGITELPHTIKPHPNLMPIIAHYSNADFSKPIYSNPKYAELIEGWRKLSPQIGMREYYGDFNFILIEGLLPVIRKDIPYWHKNLAISCDSEGGRNWAQRGRAWYIAAQLLFNVNADVDKLLKDYYQGMYGPAAKIMEQFFHNLDEASKTTQKTYTAYQANIAAEIYEDALKKNTPLIEQALSLTQGDDHKRVRMMQKALELSILMVQLSKAADRYKKTHTTPCFNTYSQSFNDFITYANSIEEEYVINPAGIAKKMFYLKPKQLSTVKKLPPAKVKELAFRRKNLDTGIYQKILDLPETWKFSFDISNTGEKNNWQGENPQNVTWENISINSFWENQKGDINGFGWYRLKINIPLDKNRNVKQLILQLGAVDESLTVFINGETVDHYEYNADHWPDSWKEPMNIDITKAFKPNTENLIVIRVHDASGKGGIWQGGKIYAKYAVPGQGK